MNARDHLALSIENALREVDGLGGLFGNYDRHVAALLPLFDDYAHELAERIRNSEELRDHTDDHMGDCEAAADLIDPEVAWP